MRGIWVATAFALMFAGTAIAAPGSDANQKLYLPLEGKSTEPSFFSAVPSTAELNREYPILAAWMGLKGHVILRCSIETDGTLYGCHADDEQPAGFGFGAAAVRLAPYYKATPGTLDGHPIIGHIAIPINFQLGVLPPGPSSEAIPTPTSPDALKLARELLSVQDTSDRLQSTAQEGMRQITAQMVAGDNILAAENVSGALRKAIDDTIADELDRRARILASTMTADQLRATIAYWKSPAGRAFTAAQSKADDVGRPNFWRRVVATAKTQICNHQAC